MPKELIAFLPLIGMAIFVIVLVMFFLPKPKEHK